MLSLRKTTARQREIIEVVFRNGWDYMRILLTGGKADEPKLPTPAVLRNILVDLGPVYIKLGQLLSTRPDLLPASYIDALSTLQAQVPPAPWVEIEATLQQEVKQPLDRVFTSIDPIPVATGSIGQTHKAILADGRQVALKIRRPGINKIVTQDITLIRTLADLVSRTEFGKTYDVVSLAEEFSTALKAEMDFTIEGNYTEELRKNLAKSKWFDPAKLIVPEIYWELTTPTLMVLEWLDGKSLLSADLVLPGAEQLSSIQRREITSLLFRAFIQQFYIDGFFHADPHPGNIFYLTDGRVALIDCGMMGRLDPLTQQILTEMLLAVVDLDAQRCAQLTIELADSSQPVDLARLESDFTRILRKYFNLNLAEINFSQILYEVLQVARSNKLRLPSNLGLYSKAIANLEGVARSFDPEVNLFDEARPLLIDLFRRQLLGNNPLQLLLRTGLDLRSFTLQSPRQIGVILQRLTSETLKWNISIRELQPLRQSINDSANRLSFSIVVGSLIIGAAIISSNARTTELSLLSSVLFGVASFLGLWLVLSILRSGRLRG
ncbi:ABC1 kinase family protein [Merismopedia glauca]|uniref:ABC transporter n=1 Tax=Merismopedia glauca CCAP 1448/3 TaxID=1296344 RepID=A0A2T1BY28_9CYAN|nr:AarF/ABC1/UbiB kinase family protein [Merismopedia glauca]PSB00773.1 ABC transporter [Merismopedia glauca CCAP 1448/3]